MLWNRAVTSERAAYIWRNGILRCGVPLGTVVFLWVVVAQFATTLDRLHTRAGWLKLGLFLLISMAEWMLGAGWLIGAGLWSLQHGNLAPAQHRVRRRVRRGGRLK